MSEAFDIVIAGAGIVGAALSITCSCSDNHFSLPSPLKLRPPTVTSNFASPKIFPSCSAGFRAEW